MDFEKNENQLMITQMVRDFAEKEILVNSKKTLKKESILLIIFPPNLIKLRRFLHIDFYISIKFSHINLN